mgnify:CR=1 FL=1
MKNSFINYAATTKHANWKNLSQRNKELITNLDDIRSTFDRDYTRIIHCNAYRRLKHKTQVFFSPDSDHICTRSEHVSHVESISYTIANYFGLNTELTKAIAVAHDIGHSPFGHAGEKILSKISQRDLNCTFWHEKNGLDFVDKIELLEDKNNCKQNLNLTYAVRDGIISHCGEIDENALKPRTNYIDLSDYTEPNQYSPYTWEGCVVKISDKISYIIRDIEDAIYLHIIDNHLDELYDLLKYDRAQKINNSNIINTLIYDICSNSSPENGLRFSDENLKLLNDIKKFNYEHIYFNKHLQYPFDYFRLVINQIFNVLAECYDNENTLEKLNSIKVFYPVLISSFVDWIKKYWNLTDRSNSNLKNKVIFDMSVSTDFYKAIIYYISGMTDNFAISCYNEIIGF